MIYKNKNGFTIIEVVAVFLLILGVTFFVLPMILNNTRQAQFISKWSEKYSEMEYIASVIKIQDNVEFYKKFNKEKDNKVIGELVLETIKPYLRIKSGVAQSQYKQNYMNKSEVRDGDKYYLDNFYYTEENQIIGLKWLTKNCRAQKPCGFLVFDLNGINQPNAWGQDIFGINILKNGIEPLGKGIDLDILKKDCDRYGSGIYCSYFYLIGGDFD